MTTKVFDFKNNLPLLEGIHELRIKDANDLIYVPVFVREPTLVFDKEALSEGDELTCTIQPPLKIPSDDLILEMYTSTGEPLEANTSYSTTSEKTEALLTLPWVSIDGDLSIEARMEYPTNRLWPRLEPVGHHYAEVPAQTSYTYILPQSTDVGSLTFDYGGLGYTTVLSLGTDELLEISFSPTHLILTSSLFSQELRWRVDTGMHRYRLTFDLSESKPLDRVFQLFVDDRELSLDQTLSDEILAVPDNLVFDELIVGSATSDTFILANVVYSESTSDTDTLSSDILFFVPLEDTTAEENTGNTPTIDGSLDTIPFTVAYETTRAAYTKKQTFPVTFDYAKSTGELLISSDSLGFTPKLTLPPGMYTARISNKRSSFPLLNASGGEDHTFSYIEGSVSVSTPTTPMFSGTLTAGEYTLSVYVGGNVVRSWKVTVLPSTPTRYF